MSFKSLGEFEQKVEDLRNKGKLTAQKAIRLKCLDCCAYSYSEVEKCELTGCPLHEFRSASAKKNRRQRLKSNSTPRKGGYRGVLACNSGE